MDDDVLTSLHSRAFGTTREQPDPWSDSLHQHALTWIGAFDADELVGFVQVAWDGGVHAFLLDTVVDPARQRSGIGQHLVSAARDEAAEAGCEWLHVDFDPHLAAFYLGACGFQPTQAGLIRLCR